MQTVIDFFMDYGAWGMFLHAFIDAVFFPIPAFFLQVSFSLVNPQDALTYATVGYIGCLLGTPLGYLIGKFLGKKVLYKIIKEKWIDAAAAMFHKNGEGAILVGSFTPIPFKVFTIFSGALNFSFWKLLIYAALGRAFKFYIVGILFYLYGGVAKHFVDNYLTWVFLGIGLLITVIWIVKRKYDQKKAHRAMSEAAGDEKKEVKVKNEASQDVQG